MLRELLGIRVQKKFNLAEACGSLPKLARARLME
jgi:hypothetical protein